jgi:CBS domain containing-hemolysin-like protein
VIWAAVIGGFLLTVFGAASGAALVTVSRAELTRAISRRLRGSAASLAWLGQVEVLLTAASATTSLGVLLLGASLPAVLVHWSAWSSAVLLVLIAGPLIMVMGYVLPRSLTQPRADTVASWLVPVLRPWSALVGLVLPSRSPSRPHDLRSIWREGAAAGLAGDDELVMVGGVMSFTQRPVREVMTPRTDIVAIPEDAALEDIIAVFGQSGYSRIPVYRGTLDEIIGMLHAFDLFRLRPGDPLPIRPVAAAPSSRSCGDLLLDMQRERRHLAVVLDEFGGTLGVVTLEDLLEELVGEIYDEHDEGARPPAVTDAAVLELDGSTPASAVEERFGVRLPEASATTIGGLLAELAGRIPPSGARLTLAGLEFDVIQATPMRIERLLIRPGPVPIQPLTGGSG